MDAVGGYFSDDHIQHNTAVPNGTQGCAAGISSGRENPQR
jgi:predicted SnoaL-like aldol condensation-catalyzing enzyme